MIVFMSIIFLISTIPFIISTIDDLPVLERLGCDDCERVYVPVCASDNKTYTNACRLKCVNQKLKKEEKIEMLYYGTCIEQVADNM